METEQFAPDFLIETAHGLHGFRIIPANFEAEIDLSTQIPWQYKYKGYVNAFFARFPWILKTLKYIPNKTRAFRRARQQRRWDKRVQKMLKIRQRAGHYANSSFVVKPAAVPADEAPRHVYFVGSGPVVWPDRK